MVMVDANVLLDLLTNDQEWVSWSKKQVAKARQGGLLVINPIIYAEISNAFATERDLSEYVSPTDFEREALPFEAAFAAGRAFRTYRARGGQRSAPLPDFYIGAHALIAGHMLLTRDAARYKTYFPKLQLIAP
jgi:predicted nucleic acid-binding protein